MLVEDRPPRAPDFIVVADNDEAIPLAIKITSDLRRSRRIVETVMSGSTRKRGEKAFLRRPRAVIFVSSLENDSLAILTLKIASHFDSNRKQQTIFKWFRAGLRLPIISGPASLDDADEYIWDGIKFTVGWRQSVL